MYGPTPPSKKPQSPVDGLGDKVGVLQNRVTGLCGGTLGKKTTNETGMPVQIPGLGCIALKGGLLMDD